MDIRTAGELFILKKKSIANYTSGKLYLQSNISYYSITLVTLLFDKKNNNIQRFYQVKQHKKSQRFLRRNRIKIDQWRARSAHFTCDIYSCRSHCLFCFCLTSYYVDLSYFIIYLLTINLYINLLHHIYYLLAENYLYFQSISSK